MADSETEIAAQLLSPDSDPDSAEDSANQQEELTIRSRTNDNNNWAGKNQYQDRRE